MVLPSNSNPDVHPNNNASNFTVSWENPICLDNNWKVALTEMTYIYSPFSLTSEHGIEYVVISVPNVTVPLNVYNESTPTINEFGTTYFTNYAQYEKDVLANEPYREYFEELPFIANSPFYENKIEFVCHSRFAIDFLNIETANALGFKDIKRNLDKLVLRKGIKRIISKPELALKKDNINRSNPNTYFVHESDFAPIRDGKKYSYQVRVVLCAKDVTHDETFHFPKFYTFLDTADMISQIRDVEGFRRIVPSISIDKSTNKICLKFANDIRYVKFLNGLNVILGLEENEFDFHFPSELSQCYTMHIPQLNRGLNNMYVYASICKDIQVGHCRVPLLKSIWIDVNKTKQRNELRNLVIINPMYIPIKSASINSIEINIRNDAGTFIPFAKHAVTSLTLHFKKI
jgi:hypothetical protein